MKTITKKRLLIISVVALVIMNLTALGVIIFHKPPFSPPPESPPIKNFERRIPPEARINRFLKESLNLTDDQMQQFLESRKRTLKEHIRIKTDLRRLRREMLYELSQETPDEQKLTEISQEVGNAHSRLKKTTIDHFLELKSICTPEQQEQLHLIFRRMLPVFERDAPGDFRQRRNRTR